MDKDGDGRRYSEEAMVDDVVTETASSLPYVYPTQQQQSIPGDGSALGAADAFTRAKSEQQRVDEKQIIATGDGPSFKDQFREARGPSSSSDNPSHLVETVVAEKKSPIHTLANEETLPSDIPIAMANLVSPSGLQQQADDETDERDDEIRRLEMQVQRLQTGDNGQDANDDEMKKWNRMKVWIFAVVIFSSIALVAGICGSGQCNGSNRGMFQQLRVLSSCVLTPCNLT